MKQKSFLQLIKNRGLILILGIGFSMLLIDSVVTYIDFKKRATEMRKSFIGNQKRVMKEEVFRTVKLIEYEREQSEKITRDLIKQKVLEAKSVADYLFQIHKNNKSRKEIIQLIIDALRPIRYADGTGYFFMTKTDGHSLLNISKQDEEGTNILQTKDVSGNYIVREFIEKLKKRKEAFFEYFWKKTRC